MDYLKTVEWIRPSDKVTNPENIILMYSEKYHKYFFGSYIEKNESKFQFIDEWIPELPDLYTALPDNPIINPDIWFKTQNSPIPPDIDVVMWFESVSPSNTCIDENTKLSKPNYRIGNVWDIHDDVPDYWMYLPHKDCIKRGPLEEKSIEKEMALYLNFLKNFPTINNNDKI